MWTGGFIGIQRSFSLGVFLGLWDRHRLRVVCSILQIEYEYIARSLGRMTRWRYSTERGDLSLIKSFVKPHQKL